jgi:hypothetical protein
LGSNSSAAKISGSNFQIDLRARIQAPIVVGEIRLGKWDLVLKLNWKLGRGNLAGLPRANVGRATKDEDEP